MAILAAGRTTPIRIFGNGKNPLFLERDKTQGEIFSGHFGNVAVWHIFNEEFRMVFTADVAEWTGKLLEREANGSQPERQPEEIKQLQTQTRKAFVVLLLDAKGWSILDWANEAGVSHATAIDFLNEKTNPFRSTRLKLAKALGIKVGHLPK